MSTALSAHCATSWWRVRGMRRGEPEGARRRSPGARGRLDGCSRERCLRLPGEGSRARGDRLVRLLGNVIGRAKQLRGARSLLLLASPFAGLALAFVVAGGAGASSLTTRTATFDDFKDGTVITDQVPGVRFLDRPVVFTPSHKTHSPPPSSSRAPATSASAPIRPTGSGCSFRAR